MNSYQSFLVTKFTDCKSDIVSGQAYKLGYRFYNNSIYLLTYTL